MYIFLYSHKTEIVTHFKKYLKLFYTLKLKSQVQFIKKSFSLYILPKQKLNTLYQANLYSLKTEILAQITKVYLFLLIFNKAKISKKIYYIHLKWETLKYFYMYQNMNL